MDNIKQSDNFEISTKWIVITGGPSSGKTTTVNQLKSLGFASSPEAARSLIDIGINSGLKIKEIRRNEKHFNQSISCIQMAVENILFPDMICFHDRGIPDSLRILGFPVGARALLENLRQKESIIKSFF